MTAVDLGRELAQSEEAVLQALLRLRRKPSREQLATLRECTKRWLGIQEALLCCDGVFGPSNGEEA